jgi:hypothetical protein
MRDDLGLDAVCFNNGPAAIGAKREIVFLQCAAIQGECLITFCFVIVVVVNVNPLTGSCFVLVGRVVNVHD